MAFGSVDYEESGFFFHPHGKSKVPSKAGQPFQTGPSPRGTGFKPSSKGPTFNLRITSVGKDSLSPLKAKHGDVMLGGGEGCSWGRYLGKKTHLLRSTATGGRTPGPALPAKLFPPRSPSCLPASGRASQAATSFDAGWYLAPGVALLIPEGYTQLPPAPW